MGKMKEFAMDREEAQQAVNVLKGLFALGIKKIDGDYKGMAIFLWN